MNKTLLFKKLYLVALIVGIISTASYPQNKKTPPPPVPMKEAMFYEKLPGGEEHENVVACKLCPRKCILKNGDTGYCQSRRNIGGKLYSLVYGKPVSIALDPIEKKPVFHAWPGSTSFSFATAGCNLRCIHCQNYQIAHAKPETLKSYDLSPEEIVNEALKSGAKSISFTYNEPTVYYEYMLDIAKLARKRGLKTVWVTSGYINPEPLRLLADYLDVARIDLKGFSEDFYQKLAGASCAPVLETLKIAKEKKLHIEVVNLIIPTYNDNPDEIKSMCVWIKENLGADTPLHFTRFFPNYKLTNLPPTPVETLERARKIARDAGLNFVYIGNVPGHEGENTYCPRCKKILIKRVGYTVVENNIINGRCKFCHRKIPGLWE